MFDLIDEKDQTSERRRLESWGGPRFKPETRSNKRWLVICALAVVAAVCLLIF